MKLYLDLLQYVLDYGVEKFDCIGIGMCSVFGWQMCFNLGEGFLLVIIKKLYLCLIIYELLWFLKGDINIGYFKDNQVCIWDEWVDVNGDFGLVYGRQWCSWVIVDGGLIDQMQWLVEEIKCNLDLWCLVVSVWNVGELLQMVLMLCYNLFQFYVIDGKFSCQFYQCSGDIFLGVLFNIVSYVLFMYMVV